MSNSVNWAPGTAVGRLIVDETTPAWLVKSTISKIEYCAGDSPPVTTFCRVGDWPP